MRTVLVSAALLSLWSSSAFAWGSIGHSVVAEIAQRNLTSTAAAVVSNLLGTNVSMPSVSSWADDFKFTPEGAKTKRWHYVDIDVSSNDQVFNEQCNLTAQGDCLPYALKREITILESKQLSVTVRAEALKFAIHLVGDLFQPLHCTERDNDGRGNGLMVDLVGNGADGNPLLTYDKKPMHQTQSFHALWDDVLIGDHTYDFGNYVDELEASVVPVVASAASATASKQNTHMLDLSQIDDWVIDCHKVGVRVYQLLPSKPEPIPLDAKYQDDMQPIIDKQLATAGLYLANVLNLILPTS